ncbi:MAG: aconitase X [Pseudonocardiaceae bacterium]
MPLPGPIHPVASTSTTSSEVRLELTAEQQAMLRGDAGEAQAMCMRIVTGLARLRGAVRLISIESAHLDGCLYHGQAGLDFVERLVEGGAQVTVPTTLNVSSLDLLHPDLVRSPADETTQARRLMDGYRRLGARPTWTCAPYQVGHRPAASSHVAWAESNAIAFCNSVLGARTDRYGDFLDVSAAITGFVPEAGLHLTENRRATLVIDCSQLSGQLRAMDSLYPVLGYLAGEMATTAVPVFTGLEDPGPSEDALKALGATAASSGGIALFHVAGVTPEAPTLDAALQGVDPTTVRTIVLDADTVRTARDKLTTATGVTLDAVSLGTPHFSLAEFAELADLLGNGASFHSAVDVWVSTSRAILVEAEAAGYARIITDAGSRIVVDTCTYVTPILDPGARIVMTNSGKWAHYAPGNIGVEVVFGSLTECVRSAQIGRVKRDDDAWR